MASGNKKKGEAQEETYPKLLDVTVKKKRFNI